MSSKLSVSRSGKILGDFPKEEVLAGIEKGLFLPTDHFWDPENKPAGWQKLALLLPPAEQSKLAAQAATPRKSPAPAPAPSPLPPKEESQWSWWKAIRVILGVIVFLIGAFVGVDALAQNPDGSAIRQAVLAQWGTNGILLMIFGLLIARK
jgi:hypothetical protein